MLQQRISSNAVPHARAGGRWSSSPPASPFSIPSFINTSIKHAENKRAPRIIVAGLADIVGGKQAEEATEPQHITDQPNADALSTWQKAQAVCFDVYVLGCRGNVP